MYCMLSSVIYQVWVDNKQKNVNWLNQPISLTRYMRNFYQRVIWDTKLNAIGRMWQQVMGHMSLLLSCFTITATAVQVLYVSQLGSHINTDWTRQARDQFHSYQFSVAFMFVASDIFVWSPITNSQCIVQTKR